MLVQLVLGNHQFCQRRRLGNDAKRQRSGSFCLVDDRQTRQNLRTQYLVSCIALTIFHRPAIRRGEKQHLSSLLLPIFGHGNCFQIVVEIARFVVVVQYEKHCFLPSFHYRSKEHWCGRSQ